MFLEILIIYLTTFQTNITYLFKLFQYCISNTFTLLFTLNHYRLERSLGEKIIPKFCIILHSSSQINIEKSYMKMYIIQYSNKSN